MTALDHAIATHRALYRAELDFNPSQRTPPVAYQYDPREGRVPDDRPLVILDPETGMVKEEVPDSATQSTQVGMPMSAEMLSYLMGPSPSTPWASALMRLRSHCRREHRRRYHAAEPHWNGALCHQFVIFVVIREWSVYNAAIILEYDNPEPLLREAFEFIEGAVDDMRAKAERRAREEAGHGPGAIPDDAFVHHAPSQEHRRECPNQACREAA